jgi:hypothetical protein
MLWLALRECMKSPANAKFTECAHLVVKNASVCFRTQEDFSPYVETKIHSWSNWSKDAGDLCPGRSKSCMIFFVIRPSS